MNDIEILKEYYGFTTKDAKYYKSQISYKQMELIKKTLKTMQKEVF